MVWNKLFIFRDRVHQSRPFIEHIEALRLMFIKMIITLIVGMIVAFCFREKIITLIQRPFENLFPHHQLQSLGIADSMNVSFSLAFYFGTVLVFPLIIYFIAQFFFPALHLSEKKIFILIMIVASVLFCTGILFSYFFVLPTTLCFFFNDASMMNWLPQWSVREYYSFTTKLFIAFGISFELPILLMLLVNFNFITIQKLQKIRPLAIVAIFTLAAFITPSPDIMTYLLLGTPMVLLYEVSIWISLLLSKNRL